MQCVVHINGVKQSPDSIMRQEVSLLFSEYTFVVMLVQVLWGKELKFECQNHPEWHPRNEMLFF